MRRSLKAVNPMRQRVDVYNALSQEEIHRWWRDWLAYLESHQAIVQARHAEAQHAFAFEQDTETSAVMQAETRLRAIDVRRRQVFDTVRDRARTAAQQDADRQARTADTPLTTPDDLEAIVLTRLLREALGTDNDGQGWVPLAPEEDTWMLIDVAAVSDAPDAAAYQVQVHAADEQRRAVLLMVGATLVAALILVGWWLWPTAPKRIVVSDAPPIVANNAAAAPWVMRTMTLRMTTGQATTLPISSTRALSWPTLAQGAPATALWRSVTPMPLTFCVPNALVSTLQTVQIASAGDVPERIYGISSEPNADERASDIVIMPCDRAARDVPAPRTGSLRALTPHADQAQGQLVSLDATATMTVTGAEVVGGGDDPTLPSGQAAVLIHVTSGAPLDWPAYAATLHLLSGTALLPANPDQGATSATLRYLIPAPTQALDAVWTVTPPSTQQAVRWRITLDAPPSRMAVLRERLGVQGAQVTATTPERFTLRVLLENRAATPLTLIPGDVVITQGDRPLALPALPALATPLAPHSTRTLDLTLPRSSGTTPLTVQIGTERFAVHPGGMR